jgi:hypothetical protein
MYTTFHCFLNTVSDDIKDYKSNGELKYDVKGRLGLAQLIFKKVSGLRQGFSNLFGLRPLNCMKNLVTLKKSYHALMVM